MKTNLEKQFDISLSALYDEELSKSITEEAKQIIREIIPKIELSGVYGQINTDKPFGFFTNEKQK